MDYLNEDNLKSYQFGAKSIFYLSDCYDAYNKIDLRMSLKRQKNSLHR